MEELKEYFEENLTNIFTCKFEELQKESLNAIKESIGFKKWVLNNRAKQLSKSIIQVASAASHLQMTFEETTKAIKALSKTKIK